MKNYRITVNGNVYDVAVEETGAGTAPAAPAAAPKAAPKAAPAAAPKAAAGAQGGVKITAPMPGWNSSNKRTGCHDSGSYEDGKRNCSTTGRNRCKY